MHSEKAVLDEQVPPSIVNALIDPAEVPPIPKNLIPPCSKT
jgi:hypothetical protein